ncbi:hypothetical protein EST38_g11616 [Candolleomyces aberdarensis]|uniref:Nephrocystin 3-like N-terminal domain-containing protein n=1 Tax=Candolleomyces aberdarensis TaxID=2316362 RepID=A0A4Q2D6Q2_9AGAR|nr:hypothetical protein EST38_g11616 [Candolleomyces aberdarensis]
MSGASYFKNANNFVVKNTTFNTYVSGIDALQFLYEHAATGAMHDSDERYPPPMCHPGTREVVIVRIKDWYGFQTRPDKPIICSKRRRASTSALSEPHSTSGGRPPSETPPARFIITIAYQLAMSIPELAPHIENNVKRNPMILRKTLEVQLMKLIVEPFKALGNLDDMPNRLVIVDGLDECINSDQECRVDRQYAEDQEKVQIRILNLIHSLQSHGLPLSFLILSRPEAWIKQHMQSVLFEGVMEAVDLYMLGDHLEDTERYIRAELSRIAAGIQDNGTPDQGDEEWPGKEVVQTFVERTNGHMLYASTVIRHIDNPYDDPRKLLKNLLNGYALSSFDLAHSSPFSSLNALYMHIMQSCPKSNRSLMVEVLEDFCTFTSYFLSHVDVRRALAILDRLAGRVPGEGFRAIRPLHAVLHLSDTRNPYNHRNGSPFIHSSFSDFLRDDRLSLEFAIVTEKAYRRILDGCLNCMSKMTLASETDEDHYRFALKMWPVLLNTAISAFRLAKYPEIMRKLLSIDLLACAIKGYLIKDSIDDISGGSFPPWGAFNRDNFNRLVHYMPDSNLLVQQAVTHVIPGPQALGGQSTVFCRHNKWKRHLPGP